MSSGINLEFERSLGEACGRLNVAHADLVSLIVLALEKGIWVGHGIRSAEHWVVWKTGVSPARAAELVQIARRAGSLPVTMETFGNGLLTADQVAAIAAFAPDDADEKVCAFARSATVSQLRSVLREYRFPKPVPPIEEDSLSNADANEPDSASNLASDEPTRSGPQEPEEQPDRVYTRFDDVGRFHLHADLSTLVGMEVEAALQEARDALYRGGDHDVTWTDALLEVCRRSMNAVASASRSDRYRVYLHVNTETAWVNGGPQLPASVRSKILCDCTVHPMLITNGKPVSVGRVTRVISLHTRRAILDRDQTCRFPGCNRTHLEVHHLVHWEHGGETNTANLAGLCSYHHHRHHDGTFRVSGSADEPEGLIFQRLDGTVIRPGPEPVTPSGPLRGPPPGTHFQHPTGERLQKRMVDFSSTAAA